MNTQFQALPWHDAVLLELSVNRASAGLRDEVILDIEWPDATRQRLTFKDCYKAELLLNFGVLGNDTIRDADVAVDTPSLVAVRERWGRLGVDLRDLEEYRITTNTTASTIVILARSLDVNDVTG